MEVTTQRIVWYHISLCIRALATKWMLAGLVSDGARIRKLSRDRD
jgi:hypothetical protein